jgi:hypothetical protein
MGMRTESINTRRFITACNVRFYRIVLNYRRLYLSAFYILIQLIKKVSDKGIRNKERPKVNAEVTLCTHTTPSTTYIGTPQQV